MARDLIAQGAIGQVSMILSFAGAGLPNYSSHQTDMFRYLLGDVDCRWVMGNVERKTDRFERSTRIEDAAVAVFEFEGGARALILADVVAQLLPGRADLRHERPDQPDHRGAAAAERRDRRQLAHPPPRRPLLHPRAEGDNFEWREGGAAQADELADWVTGALPSHRGNGQNGYKALEMIHAVYESARCHERVVLPLQTRVNPLDLMVDSGHLGPAAPRPLRHPRLPAAWRGALGRHGAAGGRRDRRPVTPIRMAQYGTSHGHAAASSRPCSARPTWPWPACSSPTPPDAPSSTAPAPPMAACAG